jgi:hypothetical protein
MLRKEKAMSKPCRHKGVEELQTDKDLQKIARELWPYEAAEQSHDPREEMRWAKARRLEGLGGCVSVGLERAPQGRFERREVHKDVMPSQAGRDVRMSCKKLERASMYQVSKKTGGTRGTSEVDQAELEKVLRELGI